MKATIIVYILTLLLIAVIMPAKAQQVPNQTRTIVFHNNATGEKIGTATIHGNVVYLRDRDGTHYATMVKNADGTRTLLDPQGNVLEKNSLSLPKISE